MSLQADQQWYDTLDDALDALRVPIENRAPLHVWASRTAATRFYTPPSMGYVGGKTADDGPAVVYFRKGSVEVPDGRGGWVKHPLPTTFTSGGGGARHTREARSMTCPSCHLALPVAGQCENCT